MELPKTDGGGEEVVDSETVTVAATVGIAAATGCVKETAEDAASADKRVLEFGEPFPGEDVDVSVVMKVSASGVASAMLVAVVPQKNVRPLADCRAADGSVSQAN